MSKISCPYCGSVQVKAMANQPKKYPRPTDPIALQEWQKGYDCKKCGNDFIIIPPKPLGLFAKFCGWVLLGLIALFFYSAFTNSSKNDTTTSAKKAISEQTNKPKQDESILHQVFSEDAEKAAHESIPTEEDYRKHESIQNSTNQNDTLNIKTTLREKD